MKKTTHANSDSGDTPDDTAKLLDDLVVYLKDYIVLPDDLYFGVVAAWILHAAAIEAFEITPRLIIRSVVKRSGKSRLISAIEMVLPNASSEINPKPASLIRSIDASGGNEAILLDEVDLYFNPKAGEDKSDVQAVLNSGFERGRSVSRYDVTTRTMSKLSVFAPVAFGSIDKLPDTLEDRGIVVQIQRRLPTETVKRFLRHEVKMRTKALKERIRAWAADNVFGLQAARPELPEDLDDRAADIWWPLFCVADRASEDWGGRMRAAARKIASDRVADDDSAPIKMLRGIWQVWPPHTMALAGTRLTELLNESDELPFSGWNDGNGINTRGINKTLAKFGIHTKSVSVAEGKPKGFHIEQFRDPWARYLGIGSATSDENRYRSDTSLEQDLISSSGNREVVGDMAEEEEDNRHVYASPYETATEDLDELEELRRDVWGVSLEEAREHLEVNQ